MSTFYSTNRRFSACRNRPNDALVLQMHDLTAEQMLKWADNLRRYNAQRTASGKKEKGGTVAMMIERDEALQLAHDILRWFEAPADRWWMGEIENGEETFILCRNQTDAHEQFDRAVDRYPGNEYRLYNGPNFEDKERVL